MEIDSKNTTDVTINFINWFKQLTEIERDFASALMIANATDDQLSRIKKLTELYGALA